MSQRHLWTVEMRIAGKSLTLTAVSGVAHVRAPPSTKGFPVQSTRGPAICAAIALMAGGLAACGEDEPTEPTTTASPISVDTESPSSSASGSSGSSSPASSDASDLPKDLPATAREETSKSAAAFGKYYLLAYGDAARSGNTSTLKKLDTSDCSVCSTAIENIKADKAKGWTKDKNPYTVSNVAASPRPDEGYKVSMDVKVASHHRVDSGGKVNGDVKATSYTVTEHVVWEDGVWQIKDWVVT